MTDEIALSAEMVRDVLGVFARHDPSAEDEFVALQYTAAVMGFLLGTRGGDAEQKNDLLNQLFEFAGHVTLEVERQRQKPSAPKQEAFGVWKPGDP
ncbi:MAG: hypothetical protein ACFCUG_03975 [Thiotrichales bacterium]